MRYEVRQCDYCDLHTGQYAISPEELAKKGWAVDDEGRDVCPVCVFTEDTGPLRDALETFADAVTTPSVRKAGPA